MRTNFKFALMSAAALLSLGLASCSSNDEAEVNPTFDGKAVKTTFSISLPGAAKTRMAGETVQVGEDIASFRGMSNIVIIPFSHATNRATRLGANITLAAGTMQVPAAANDANAIPAGKLLANNNAVLYNNVSIPVGTSAFLFYGKAKGTDGYEEGFLTPTKSDGSVNDLTGETSDIFFSPTQIQKTPVTTKGVALATYVSNIAKAADGDAAWYKCTDASNSTQTWYSAALGDLYTSFTSLTPGASSYVQAAVRDLYKTVLNNTNPIAVKIRQAITDATYVSAFDASTGDLTFTDAINNYPGEDNNSMPDGCATLSWTVGASGALEAKAETNSTFGGGLPANGFTTAQAMNKIVYPASLYYFVDSPVETSVTSREADYIPGNTWATILTKYTNGQSVTTTTRSVAITNPIQYAVGRLDVTVNGLTSGTTYYDRRGEAVTIPADGFELTGVLIGGQKKVDYKFNQVTTAEEYAIYDKTINTKGTKDDKNVTVSTKVKVGGAAGPNYTLALETDKDQEVYVALEFLNNSGKDFMGVNGVVKDGCKFYMIAKLTPTDATGTVSGSANTGNKVFKQDFKTIANFTFGVGSQDLNTGTSTDGVPDGVADAPGGFGNAYVTIPDLRTPKLELGFSVDLEWQKGITYNLTF